MLATAALMSSRSGLPHWSAAWPNSNQTLLPARNLLHPNLPESLVADLTRYDAASVVRALDRAVVAAAGELADGVAAYRHHSYRRADDDFKAIWRSGSTALLNHADAGAGSDSDIPALFVPSLVNRGWVLDLVPGQGMLSWLAKQGVRPFRIEWGPPGNAERSFAIADYVRLRLEPALDEVLRVTGKPPVLVGYCMGGLVALAGALRRPDAIRGLVLLATPWDFHADGPARAQGIGAFYRATRPFLGPLGAFPIDLIQALFAMHDPIVALRKFRRFASLDPDSAEARNFVALEDWLNDGVALTLPVADEAFLGWYEANDTCRLAWAVDGTLIDPAALSRPALVVVPGGDKLVSPSSAAAIIPALRDGARLDLPLGHIGMVVGRKAEKALWDPLAEWIRSAA